VKKGAGRAGPLPSGRAPGSNWPSPGEKLKAGGNLKLTEAREVGMNAVVRTVELPRSPTSVRRLIQELGNAVDGIQLLSPSAQVRASGSRFRDVYDINRSLAPRRLSGGRGRFES
jgi:hypothetical protein